MKENAQEFFTKTRAWGRSVNDLEKFAHELLRLCDVESMREIERIQSERKTVQKFTRAGKPVENECEYEAPGCFV